ncbi:MULTISPECIES: DUF4214 domain-containing protein [Pseudomonas]|uniref:DUF4214 domain-containing protein n=3 Tax=Pseudomonas TaxID=286 RepID=A0ABX6HKY4_9PSED|nr:MULTISPECIES: DUF4214 domain-containing protein [Pseudomonas]MBC3956926.1 DUF4214 domain-containing protein [Pseudomonas triticifolii]QHF05968.1 DUF4214 domain-containing protein [Pseudomonas asturiensis]
MATLKLYQPIDMNALQAWDGTFPIVEAGHIQATDGVRTQDYFGSFQFSNGEVSGGVLTSTVAYQNGAYYEVSGFNLDAGVMAEYIGNFDINGALTEILKGDDTLIGSAGNDVLKGGGGNNAFDGGAGIDTVYYNGGKHDVSIPSSGNTYTVSHDGGTDTLNNIERIDFGPGSVLALDVKAGENAGSAYRLYQAAFDRKPDTSGLKYWINELDTGANLQQIAQGFVDSAEFKTLNPSNDATSIINNLYQHVLHRDADEAGAQYWKSAMAEGMSTHEVLVSFSESQENISNAAAALNSGLWLV